MKDKGGRRGTRASLTEAELQQVRTKHTVDAASTCFVRASAAEASPESSRGLTLEIVRSVGSRLDT